MKNRVVEKVSWHLKAALEWANAVAELFPALWEVSIVFSALLVDYCEGCQKPRTVLWVPVGEHGSCESDGSVMTSQTKREGVL
jgi:hypothetical protein